MVSTMNFGSDMTNSSSFTAIQNIIRLNIKNSVSYSISNDVWKNLSGVIGRNIEDTMDTQLWVFFYEHLEDWLE